MWFCNSGQLSWFVTIAVVMITTTESGLIDVTETFYEDYIEDDMQDFMSAVVTHSTSVHRRRRSVYDAEESTSFTEWYDFPEKMTFTVNTERLNLVLNLTRNMYARTDVTLSDETGNIETDFKSRFGIYYSVEQGASVLVECEMDTCALHGTVTIKGELFHIEQDQSSANLEFHSLRKKNTPDLEKFLMSMYDIPAGENKQVDQGHSRKRRSTSVLPDCDIIEVAALLDDTIWDYYVDKYGGDETRANEDIWKYVTSAYAEVDFRLRCLTDYFTDYKHDDDSACVVKCLRVILVKIIITKTSSWTDGNFYSGSTTMVRGQDGLVDCGQFNYDRADNQEWDHLMCATRLDLIYHDGSWKNLYRTVGYSTSICHSDKKKQVSVQEMKGDGFDLQVAHALLYGMKGPKDSKQSCSQNGFFLMREPQSEKPTNPGQFGEDWYLSDCTVGPICTYIKGLSTNCLRTTGNLVNDTIWKQWESEQLPGEIFSTDEQCKVRWGNDSVQCDPSGEGNLFPDDLCSKYMYCTSGGQCICQVRVSSGTPCSPCAKICRKGRCILIPDVPLGDECECHSQCAGDNSACEPGPDDCGICTCKDDFYNNNGNCTSKIPNGGDCDETFQCVDENALCINYTCKCRPGFYNMNGRCEKQSCLGGPCNVTAQCEGDNTVCDPTRDICVCEEGYFVDETGNCIIFNGTLCDPCTQAPDSCTQSDTECSDDGFCVCTSNTVEVDGECYGTLIGERCTTVIDTCSDNGAGCNGSVCVCNDNFVWNGTRCVGFDLCDPCDPSNPTCDSELVCNPVTYRCECPDNQAQIGDTCYGTRVTESCTQSLDTCTDKNADCNGTICNCIAGFVWNGSICVGQDICDPCDPSINMCLSPLVCNPSTYTCACPPDQVQIEDKCYGTRVTEDCTTTIDTCIDDYAECNGTVCNCICGFTWNGSRCVGPDLCDPCDPSVPSCDSSLECSSDTYRCECPPDRVQIGDTCYGTRVSETCTSQPDTCSDNNAECNGTVCVCVAGFVWNGSMCVGSDLCDPCDPSNPTCDSELVCSADTYRCACPPGRVQIGDACYGTRVTEDCTGQLSTCTDINAECNGTICNCIQGFTWNGSVCVGPDLCDPCDPAIMTCDSSLVCSQDTYRCECPTDQVQVGDACYGTRVGEPCTTATPTCTDNNAECNGTVCVCNSGFTWNGTLCVGPDLCDPCDPSIMTCDSSFVCSPDTYRCECPTNQVQVGDACFGTRVTEVCTTMPNTCTDENAVCNGTICDCISGFTWNGSICVGPDLCDPCDPSIMSCDSSLVCSPDTYRCECPPNQVHIGNECYGTRVTERCTQSLPTCIDNNAECNGTVCVCKSGFTWNGSVCVGPDLCDPCDPSNSTCGPPLVCNPDTDTCDCPPGFVQIGDMCYGTRVTEDCTNTINTCIDDYAECNGTICDCILCFTWNGSRCVGPDLCDPCDPSTPSCDSRLVCSSDTYRCECPSDQVQIGDECYGTRVNESCTGGLNTCTDDYAECNGTVCVCVATFIWNGSHCVGPNLCDPCDPSTPSCDSSLVCNSDTYRCECPHDRVQIGNACFGTRVTEECTSTLNTCIDHNAECNGTICNCINGFMWNGSVCVGPDLCDTCDPSMASCDSSFVCNPQTLRCECPSDQVQIGCQCYGTRVTESCTTTLDTCTDINADCNDTICDCIEGFVWNGSICVGPSLCDPCDPSTSSCDSSLVCSSTTYRCECPPGRVQVEGACYGTRVTEDCTTTIDTCTDDNAECNGTICNCISGFTWNGSSCVGSELCDPCDTSISSCSMGLVCNPDTYRCECPPGEVQIGDECFGRHVSETCTSVVDTCIDDRAKCNGTICNCITGYAWNGSICVGTDLCDPCDPSVSLCASPLVCNPSTDRCECPPGLVQIGNACYGTRVTETCTEPDTCIDDNAECNGTICVCVAGFIWNGSLCVGPDLCDPCDPATQSCDSGLECNSETYRCECPANLVQIGDNCYGTRIGEACTGQLDTCSDNRAVCNGTVCDCMSGFTWNGSDCVGTELCDPCDPALQICTGDLVCSTDTYRCECPPNRVQIGNDCFGRRVNEDCTQSLDTCIDDRARCNGSICVCNLGFTWNGFICVGSELDDPCTNDTCSGNLVCNLNTSRCACPPNLVRIEDLCYGTRVNEDCTIELPTCIDDNAECSGSTCTCVTGFIWNGSLCVGPGLCDPCDPSTTSCDPSLECSSDTYRCECPADKVQIGDECFGTRVTQVCTNDLDTCTDNNAACNGTICNCLPGFAWNGSICVGSNLCDPCDPSTSSCDSSLVCSADTFRCECPSNQVQIGEECFGTRVGDSCTPSLDTCVDDRARCNGTICNCLPGFSWNGSVCVGEDLCDPCNPVNSSCGSPLVCSDDTFRCECPPNHVQVGASCFGTRVTESCTLVVNTCIDDNAMCNGTVCVCMSGLSWNGSICVGSDLCDPCDAATLPCNSPLVCGSDSYRCECPPNLVQIGDACYGTHVSEVCTTTPDTCSDNNAECNGTICDCVSGFTWNGSSCVGQNLCDPCDPSTPSCDSGLVCSADTYRCECPPGRVQIADNCYGTRVTEVCTDLLNTCIDHNADCNGTICNCKSGYIWNGSICVGDDLCDPCDQSTLPCDSGLVCSSDTYRCECPPDQVQVGDACYGTRVTESCSSVPDTCTDDNAECNGTICVCESGFVWNGTVCVGTNLCDPCDPSTSSCDSSLVCSPDTYRCECPPDRVQIGEACYGTRVTEPCSPVLNTCVDNNAECNGTICNCVPGFVWNGSICVGPNLCDPCDPATQSCDSSLVCSTDTYRCECPSPLVQIGDNCYGTRVGEECSTQLNTCIDDKAECNGTVCNCMSGYVWNGSICVGQDLCDPCDPSTLSCDSGLVCNSDTYRCECPPGQVQIGDACYGRFVTESCTPALDTCIDKHADCNGTVCNCVSPFTWNGSICVGPNLCDPCDSSTPSCDSGLVCSADTYKCECPSSQVQIGNACYGTRVTETCTPSFDVCIDDNAACNGTICDCLTGYVWNGSICVGSDVCDPCDPSVQSCDSSLVCNPDTYRCECPSNQVQIGASCYGTRVTESCTASLDTCIDDNAGCNGTICNCDSGFSWNGSVCVGSDLCDPCDPSITSCDSGLVCSAETYRCECPTNQVQIGDACYGTRVTEACTVPDTCTDNNAECNGTVCDCTSGFTWNGSVCVGADLCDPCDPSISSCASPLVCNSATYTCECPPGRVQIGNACYGTRVTDDCTTSLDTCIDDNAECNGTVCDCLSGFTWNGSICVGSELCDTCDPSTPSCDSSLVCSSDTYRCECPSNQVQIGNACYGTRVTESCTSILNTCSDNNAECNGTVCDCVSGYTWNGSICVGTGLCDPCDTSLPSCDSSLVCSPDTYRCECPTNQVQIGEACYGTLVTESCTTALDTCTDKNADCNGTVCDCVSPFTWNGSICVGAESCDPCDAATLLCNSPLVCGQETYRCECPSGLVQIGDTCYGTLIGENCTSTLSTCIDNNARCSGAPGVCECIPPFTWNATLGKCVGPSLDDPCDSDSCGPGLACGSISGNCECETPPLQIDNVCYGTHIGDVCTSAYDTCIDDNAMCNGSVCTCKVNFAWNGIICVGKELDDPCDSSSVSCLANGLVCGSSGKCECPDHLVQVDNMCLSLICGPCTDDGDCNGANQTCVNNTCQCETGFYLDNCSICQPKIPNQQPCESDEQCISNICICDVCEASTDDDCCEDCDEIKADIIFVTDNSGSVGSNNYQIEKAFVISLINNFIVSPGDTQIGLVDYSSNIIEGNTFNMNVYVDNLAVTTKVQSNSYAGGATRTDLALNRVTTYFNSGADRPGILNFAVVITDGNTNSGGQGTPLANAANALQQVAEVFAVGIGGGVSLSELQLIASDDDNVFVSTGFNSLDEITLALLDAICSDAAAV